jgi:hypothetical protein
MQPQQACMAGALQAAAVLQVLLLLVSPSYQSEHGPL